MNHYIYKITSLINGKYYIGCRSSKRGPIEDEYLGSGDWIKRSIRKYGKENFYKEIICICNTKEEKFKKEREIVNEKLLKDPLCMNIVLGGSGGYVCDLSGEKNGMYGKPGPWKGKKLSEETKTKLRTARAKQIMPSPWNKGRPLPQEIKDKISRGLIGNQNTKGYQHSEETRKKISEANRGNTKGFKRGGVPWNSGSRGQRIWITDGTKNKVLLKTDLIPEGWRRGRI